MPQHQWIFSFTILCVIGCEYPFFLQILNVDITSIFEWWLEFLTWMWSYVLQSINKLILHSLNKPLFKLMNFTNNMSCLGLSSSSILRAIEPLLFLFKFYLNIILISHNKAFMSNFGSTHDQTFSIMNIFTARMVSWK